MTDKNILLKDLLYIKNFEEDAVTQLTTLYSSLNWREIVEPKFQDEIERALTTLRSDSQKHARLVQEALVYIEGSDKNDF